MANKVYVGGLSSDTADDELRTFFEQVGTVRTASVITERDSGRSKGFAFVEMSTEAEAQRAIAELNGKTLGGRVIRVAEARPPGPGEDRSGCWGATTVSALPSTGFASSTTSHHWLIGKQDGPTSEGVCRNCGARREFENGFVSAYARATRARATQTEAIAPSRGPMG